jgi:hypothetical protein
MVNFIRQLEDTRKQKARICIYSQGYLAYSIRIGGFWDRAKGRWNKWAFSINRRFEKTVERHGDIPLIKEFKPLPTFLCLENALMNFARETTRDYENK